MPTKETKGSLSAVLLIFGFGGLFYHLSNLMTCYDPNIIRVIPYQALFVARFVMGLELIASFGYVFGGISFSNYLKKNTAGPLLNIVIFKGVVSIVAWVYLWSINIYFNPVKEMSVSGFLLLFVLFITWYLYSRIQLVFENAGAMEKNKTTKQYN